MPNLPKVIETHVVAPAVKLLNHEMKPADYDHFVEVGKRMRSLNPFKKIPAALESVAGQLGAALAHGRADAAAKVGDAVRKGRGY